MKGNRDNADGIVISVSCAFPEVRSDLPQALEGARLGRSRRAIRYVLPSVTIVETGGSSLQSGLEATLSSFLTQLVQGGVTSSWLEESGGQLRLYISLVPGLRSSDILISKEMIRAWDELGAEFRFDALG